jgi:hypothetical protein
MSQNLDTANGFRALTQVAAIYGLWILCKWTMLRAHGNPSKIKDPVDSPLLPARTPQAEFRTFMTKNWRPQSPKHNLKQAPFPRPHKSDTPRPRPFAGLSQFLVGHSAKRPLLHGDGPALCACLSLSHYTCQHGATNEWKCWCQIYARR